jgi:hypothetical protein
MALKTPIDERETLFDGDPQLADFFKAVASSLKNYRIKKLLMQKLTAAFGCSMQRLLRGGNRSCSHILIEGHER